MFWILPELLIILISILALSVVFYYKYSFLYWKKKEIDSPPASIPFGNAKDIFIGKISQTEVLRQFYNQFKTKGQKFIGFFVFTKPVFMILDPKLLNYIMVKDFSTFSDRGLNANKKVDPLHYYTVGCAKNPKWKQLRTKLSPAFTSVKLRQMMPLILECGEKLSRLLQEASRCEDPIDIKSIYLRFTTDCMTSIALGLDVNCLSNTNNKLYQLLSENSSPSLRQSVSFTLGFFAPKTLLKFLRIPFVTSRLSNFFTVLMKHVINEREKYNIDKNDMLNVLIKLKNNRSKDDNYLQKSVFSITFNELTAQSYQLFAAGSESTSATITFAIFEMAKNLKIQEKLREEIICVLEKYDGEITYEGLNEMTYLDWVVKGNNF